MTEREAIEELKYDCNELGKAIPCDTSWGSSFENAYRMAMQALEKTAKKPRKMAYIQHTVVFLGKFLHIRAPHVGICALKNGRLSGALQVTAGIAVRD